MEGITTAIVAYMFLCVAMPRLVKNKPQFYTVFVIVLALIVTGALAAVTEKGFHSFIMVLNGLLQFVAVLLLVLASGGLSLHELSSELGNAYEVMRRGDTERTVIIPPTGDQPRPRPAPRGPAAAEPQRYEILDPPPSAAPTPPPGKPGDEQIPLA